MNLIIHRDQFFTDFRCHPFFLPRFSCIYQLLLHILLTMLVFSRRSFCYWLWLHHIILYRHVIYIGYRLNFGQYLMIFQSLLCQYKSNKVRYFHQIFEINYLKLLFFVHLINLKVKNVCRSAVKQRGIFNIKH